MGIDARFDHPHHELRKFDHALLLLVRLGRGLLGRTGRRLALGVIILLRVRVAGGGGAAPGVHGKTKKLEAELENFTV